MQGPSLAEKFIQFLHRLGYKRQSEATNLLGLPLYWVDLSPLRLRFSDQSPFIEIGKLELDTRPADAIFNTVKDIILQLEVHDRIPIALVEGVSATLRQLANQPPYYVVVLDSQDIGQIMASRTPTADLLERIRPQVPLSFLSPYEVSAAVTAGQFFGREYETRMILTRRDTCFTIFGTRRIGKTSILREVRRQMGEVDPAAKSTLIYLDCMQFTNSQAFLERLISMLEAKELRRMMRQSFGYLSLVPRFMHNMHKKYGRRITFFLDEADYLIQFDRPGDYETIKSLRASFQEGSCRVIFAGFREMQRAMNEPDSPLNFTTLLPLDNFRYSEAASLIDLPMTNLGVAIESRDQVIRRIYQETAGHPNFIQHYCFALMRQLDAQGERRITPDHLDKLTEDFGFRNRVFETFASNTTDIEKAVAYAIADKTTFTVEDVNRVLIRHRLFLEVAILESALSKLRSLGVTEKATQGDRFTVPILPQLILDRYGADFLYQKALEAIKLRPRSMVS